GDRGHRRLRWQHLSSRVHRPLPRSRVRIACFREEGEVRQGHTEDRHRPDQNAFEARGAGVSQMARRQDEKLKVRYTTGSVFHALDLPDADDLIVKADLIARLEAIIRERGLTQVRTAALLGMDQPKVSALLRGRLDLFSIGRLIRALRDLGQDMQVTAISTAK